MLHFNFVCNKGTHSKQVSYMFRRGMPFEVKDIFLLYETSRHVHNENF